MSYTVKNLYECMSTKNDCYIRNTKERKLPSNQQDYRYRNYYQGPTKIVVHSTGANNPWLKRYVQPDDGILGTNKYGNSWNKSGLDVCVNAFIGKVADGTVAVYQTLPWEYRPWGVGSGSRGSYNDCAIQFEICEDDLTSANYAKECYECAAQLCAYLCDTYNIPVDGIVSHAEAYKLGYGSNHGDPEHWWPKFGLTMDGFRARVQEILDSEKEVLEMTETELRDICKDEIEIAKSGDNTGDIHSDWADEAINWAVKNGIINGFGNGDMGYRALLTREQMAVMLHRFAKLMDKA